MRVLWFRASAFVLVCVPVFFGEFRRDSGLPACSLVLPHVEFSISLPAESSCATFHAFLQAWPLGCAAVANGLCWVTQHAMQRLA